MKEASRPASRWVVWLSAAALGVMGFGLLLVLAPALVNRAFSLLLYAEAGHIAGFDGKALAHVSLAHAVLGAVMLGWGALLLLIARGRFARGAPESWHLLSLSIAAWFVPDTAFSLWAGFWQNAALNAALATLFAIPLAATYRVFHAASR